MKKFTEFYEDSEINEKLIQQKKLPGDPRKVSLIIEPTDKEIESLLHSNPIGIRGGIDRNGQVYVWRFEISPKIIEREFEIPLIAEIMWDANNRKDIMIRLLSSQKTEINPAILKKIEDEIVFAFPFIKKYHLVDYTNNEIETKEIK